MVIFSIIFISFFGCSICLLVANPNFSFPISISNLLMIYLFFIFIFISISIWYYTASTSILPSIFPLATWSDLISKFTSSTSALFYLVRLWPYYRRTCQNPAENIRSDVGIWGGTMQCLCLGIRSPKSGWVCSFLICSCRIISTGVRIIFCWNFDPLLSLTFSLPNRKISTVLYAVNRTFVLKLILLS